MTDQTAQEPTMEEILASIRRIISEDDAPAETATATPAPEDAFEAEPEETPPPAMEEPASSPEPAAAADEDVLELTDTYETQPAETIGDLDVTSPEPFPAASESSVETPEVHTPTHPSVPAAGYDPLVGDSASASAASAFAGFASTLRKPEPEDISFPSGPTIDEMVRGLLRPMLKDWLDANLPAIVETQVRKEVERIARSAG